MQDEFVFRPERRMGLIFHLIAIFIFSTIALISLWLVTQARIGISPLFYLLPVLIAAGVVPILAYRVYALQTATYTLERDGFRLRWGLRYQDIPMDQVLWVLPAAELVSPLPLPRLRMPGALLGKRHTPEAGAVEFLADGRKNLLLIATPEGGYAISPAEPIRFLQTFQRLTELGSLSPLPLRSVYPAFLLARVWSSTTARALLSACLVLSLALLVWVGLVISDRSTVNLSFRPDGSPGESLPAASLTLLPAMNTFFLFISLLLGLFTFRNERSKPVSFLLWASSALVSLFFLVGLFFILRSG
jgi:hypothetical protein